MKIAICEDNENDANVLMLRLNEAYRSELCDLYSSAFLLLEAYAEGKRYDLIFMDIEMPGISGYDAAKLIYDTYPAEFPLIVFLTVTSSYVYSAYYLGWAYKIKPITPEDLSELLNRAVKKSVSGVLR